MTGILVCILLVGTALPVALVVTELVRWALEWRRDRRERRIEANRKSTFKVLRGGKK